MLILTEIFNVIIVALLGYSIYFLKTKSKKEEKLKKSLIRFLSIFVFVIIFDRINHYVIQNNILDVIFTFSRLACVGYFIYLLFVKKTRLV